MLLYDIFYTDKSMDSARPLPTKPSNGTRYAVCINGERIYYVPKRGQWEALEEQKTCAR